MLNRQYYNNNVHNFFYHQFSDKFLHATSLVSIPLHGILFIGQSDGSIKLLQCANDLTISQQIIAKKSRPITSKPKPLHHSPSPNENLLAAKSCAIQNIIKDERHLKQNEIDSSESLSLNYNYKQTPLNVLPTKFISSIFANCIHEQILLHGLSLKQHYTKTILCAIQTGYLFAQCGQQMRCYNIEKCVEKNIANGKISTDIALACDTNNKEYLVSYLNLNFRFLI